MKKIITILTLAIGLFTACDSDNDGLTPANKDERVPLTIVASIKSQPEAITRASESSWEDGDEIGVFVTKENDKTLYVDEKSVKVGENLKFTFNDGTNYETYGNTYRIFAPNTKKIYLSSAPADVYGYYPYKAVLNPEAININISDQSSQKDIDFMWARKGNVNNGTAAIELLFKHRLVKLVFNLKQGEGLLPNELNDATYLGMVIRDQYYEATYDIYKEDKENPFTIIEDKKDIRPHKMPSAPTGYVRTFEAIVLPNSVITTSNSTYSVTGNPPSKRTIEITFYRKTEDQIVNKFVIPTETVFKAGYKYTFNVTVNATTVTVDTQKYTEQW